MVGSVAFDENVIKNSFTPTPNEKPHLSEEVLRKAIFAEGSFLPLASKPHISSLSMGTSFMVSDYTSLYRAFQDTAVSYFALHPKSDFWGLKELFAHRDVALGYHAFGTTSGLGAFIGASLMRQDLSEMAYVDTIGDKRASLMQRVSLVRDGSLMGASIGFVVFRILSMLDAARKSAPSLMGRIASGFLYLGLSLFAVFFTLYAVVYGTQIYEGTKLQKKLSAAKNLEEKLAILQKKIGFDPQKLAEKFQDQELIEEGSLRAKIAVEKLIKEIGVEGISKERLEEVTTAILEEGKFETSDFLLLGLQGKVQKVALKKKNKMMRLLGKEGMEALSQIQSEGKGLQKRVTKGDTGLAQDLVKKVEEANRNLLKERSVVLSVFILGIISMVLPIICAAGTGLLLSSAAMLVFSILMLGVDAYYLAQSYREDVPAIHDRKLLIVSSVIAVASMTTVIALGATGVVAMGGFPLIVSIVLLTFWLIQNGVSWKIMDRNEKRYYENVMKELQDPEKVVETLSQISNEVKGKIIEKLLSEGNPKLLALIEKIEKQKKGHLEVIRRAVMPHMIG